MTVKRSRSAQNQRCNVGLYSSCRFVPLAIALLFLCFTISPASAQSSSGGVPAASSPQRLPDAPLPQNNSPAATAPVMTPDAPATGAPESDQQSSPTLPDKNAADQPAPPSRPSPENPIPTVSQGAAANVPGSPRDDLFRLTRNVNFVVVPVTIKDKNGQLVNGLQPRDFAVFEDSVQQEIKFFTSDPFPLSAVIILDQGLPDITWRKVRDTLPALIGAFSPFDEVAIFTYSNVVRQVQDFTGTNAEVLSTSVRQLKTQTGKTGGPPVVGGPLYGGPNPSINGKPVQPGTPEVPTMPRESSVLNDAILQGAMALSRREPTRRKILFVISDGREVGSTNTYNDVLRVLLTHQISVYAVGVGGGGTPGYRQLQRIRIPGQGFGDILPKYASATGGEVFPELSQQAIEQAYAKVTEEARNQYTLGYTTAVRPSSNYRSIEVRVHLPDLRVFARDGYYPLPPEK